MLHLSGDRSRKRFDVHGEGMDQYVQLFQNKAMIRVVEESTELSAKSCDHAGTWTNRLFR